MQKKLINELKEMLSYKRVGGSNTEKSFINRFIAPLGGYEDKFGNHIVTVGDRPNIMFSSHTDTVHSTEGFQEVEFRKTLAVVKGDSNCLGADDGAGVFLMRQMILNKVPGLYIFHRFEEHGGLGSKFILNNTPEILNGIDFAIAFDRRGESDIITHQFGGRCCSTEFAVQLGAMLGEQYKPSSFGSFTDTATYVGKIKECTNVSIGYDGEHSPRENLNVLHLFSLLDALIKAPWHQLRAHDWVDEVESQWDAFGMDDVLVAEEGDIVSLVQSFPEEIADILELSGYSYSDLKQQIANYYSENTYI